MYDLLVFNDKPLAEPVAAAAAASQRVSEKDPRSTIITSSDGYRNSTSSDGSQQFRRPFGCAVLEMTQLAAMAAEQTEVSSSREHTMPIYVPTNETTFSMLHQDILNHNVREYEKSPR